MQSELTDPNGILKQSKIIIGDNREEQQRLTTRKQLKYQFFMFLNQKSGGSKADQLIGMDAERIKFQIKDQEDENKKHETEVFIYNLTDTSQRDKGFNMDSHIRIIIGGGDGTVPWVIQEMVMHNIEVDKVPLGIIPFGTGNDFSRVLGWGGGVGDEIVGKQMKILRNMIRRWIGALTEEFDIWDMELQMKPDGKILEIKKDNTGKLVKMPKNDAEGNPITYYSKIFCNYVSMGIDARVGLGFDKKRTKSQICNKVVYACEGFKKMFIKTPKVNAVVSNLEQMRQEDLQEKLMSNINIDIKQQEQKEKEEKGKDIVFSTETKDNPNAKLESDPASLLILNINSFAGGSGDPWEICRGKSGLANQKDNFDNQSFGDGKIEFLSFQSSTDIAKLRMFKSGAFKRVFQGKGPFKLNFRQSDETNDHKPVHTYFQVDGEYYKLINPLSLVIKQTPFIPRGKIKVLLDRQSLP